MLRPRHSFCAFALLTLWVGGPLVGAAHLQIEEHSFCSEHQALEHRQLDSTHVGQSDASKRTEQREQSLLTRLTSEPDHEQCFVAESRSLEQYTLTEDPGADSPINAFVEIHVCSQTLDPVIAILIGAPKNSPPLLLS